LNNAEMKQVNHSKSSYFEHRISSPYKVT